MKKMNWGSGITAVIVIFFIAMGFMVTFAMHQTSDLVSENYYEKELKYQDRINSTQRAVNLPDAVRLTGIGDTLSIRFSSGAAAHGMHGTVYFYRPSDKRKDFHVPISLDRSGMQCIATGVLAKGLWKVQLEWTTTAGEYYAEQPFVVN